MHQPPPATWSTFHLAFSDLPCVRRHGVTMSRALVVIAERGVRAEAEARQGINAAYEPASAGFWGLLGEPSALTAIV